MSFYVVFVVASCIFSFSFSHLVALRRTFLVAFARNTVKLAEYYDGEIARTVSPSFKVCPQPKLAPMVLRIVKGNFAFDLALYT